MSRVLTLVATVATVLWLGVTADARELGRPVHPKDGKNVVAGTGEVLDYALTATREESGAVLVNVVIPAGSALQKASHLRLEVRKGGQILLWSQLATRKRDDGAMVAGFQIHESLAKDAFVAIVYDGGGAERRGGMFSYQVPVAEYIADRKPAAP